MTTTTITIKGKINNVRWLETEGAEKVETSERRYNSYKTLTAYQLEVADDRLSAIIARLNDVDGIWYETAPGFDLTGVLADIAELGKQAPERVKPELREIYKAVRDGGEAAFQRHYSRLDRLGLWG